MKEYIIRSAGGRKPATLKTACTDPNLIDEEVFKKNAKTIHDFLCSQVASGTIIELKKMIEKANWWEIHNPEDNHENSEI